MPGAMPGTPAPLPGPLMSEVVVPGSGMSLVETVAHGLVDETGAAVRPSLVQVCYRSVSYTSYSVTVGMEFDVTAYNTEANLSGHTWQGLWFDKTNITEAQTTRTAVSILMPSGATIAVNFATSAWELVFKFVR